MKREAGVGSSLVPAILVCLLITIGGVEGLLNFGSFAGNSWFISLNTVSVMASLVMVVWGQSNLNTYWDQVSDGVARSAGSGPGEVVISLAGAGLLALVIWGTVAPGPGVASVYHAGPISPLTVGQETVGTIEGMLEADAYSFEALSGQRFIIQT